MLGSAQISAHVRTGEFHCSELSGQGFSGSAQSRPAGGRVFNPIRALSARIDLDIGEACQIGTRSVLAFAPQSSRRLIRCLSPLYGSVATAGSQLEASR